MKKKTLVILAAILLISSFSACGDKASSKDDSHSLINYTDTVENSSGISSKTADIEHSAVSSGLVAESDNSSGKDTVSSKNNISESKQSGSSSDKNTSSTVSNTVNTITYYYENDVHTESDTEQTSSTEEDSDLSSDIDSDSNTDLSTDTTSSQPFADEPVEDGSYNEEDIAFYFNGEKIYLGDEINAVKDIIGEPNDIDKSTYNYDDFWISVAESEDSEEAFVEEIQIFNNTIETEKGIKVGMTSEDLIKAYGNSNAVIKDEQRYYVGNKCMYFYVQNGIVADIGYRIDHEVEVDNETE